MCGSVGKTGEGQPSILALVPLPELSRPRASAGHAPGGCHAPHLGARVGRPLAASEVAPPVELTTPEARRRCIRIQNSCSPHRSTGPPARPQPRAYAIEFQGAASVAHLPASALEASQRALATPPHARLEAHCQCSGSDRTIYRTGRHTTTTLAITAGTSHNEGIQDTRPSAHGGANHAK